MTYELKSNGVVIDTFDTAQEAMDYGEAYCKDGYTITAK
jgi:hypothetical protein